MQENNERQEALQFLMENLRPRERKVLDLRFGLTGNGTHSLRQIGHLLRISKERVRQIQNRALEKLRASPSASAGSRACCWSSARHECDNRDRGPRGPRFFVRGRSGKMVSVL